MRTLPASALPLLTVFALAFALGGCKKDEPAPPVAATPTAPAAPVPTFAGTYGVLVAEKINFTFTQALLPVPVTLPSEIAFAAFGNGTAANTFLDAGAVAVNGTALEKQSNNAYTKVATVGLTPATLNFDASTNWTMAGGSGVNALSYNYPSAFPSYTGTLPTSVTRSAGLTVPLGSNLTGADSVYVQLSSGNVTVLRRLRGGSSAAVFTAAQLAALPTTTAATAAIQVVPFRYLVTSLGGRAYAFVKLEANSALIAVN